MRDIKIKTEYIKLGQLLKFADIISNGGEEKAFLATNKVWVNGELEDRRGRKLYKGDVVKVLKEEIKVEQDED